MADFDWSKIGAAAAAIEAGSEVDAALADLTQAELMRVAAWFEALGTDGELLAALVRLECEMLDDMWEAHHG
jgi:hypothetical protein